MKEAQFYPHLLRGNGDKCYPPPFDYLSTKLDRNVIHIYAKSPNPVKGNHIVGEIHNVADYSLEERKMMADNYAMLLEQQWHNIHAKEST